MVLTDHSNSLSYTKYSDSQYLFSISSSWSRCFPQWTASFFQWLLYRFRGSWPVLRCSLHRSSLLDLFLALRSSTMPLLLLFWSCCILLLVSMIGWHRCSYLFLNMPVPWTKMLQNYSYLCWSNYSNPIKPQLYPHFQ